MSAGRYCTWMAFVLMSVALWALVFGVTIDGRHYHISACAVSGPMPGKLEYRCDDCDSYFLRDE